MHTGVSAMHGRPPQPVYVVKKLSCRRDDFVIPTTGEFFLCRLRAMGTKSYAVSRNVRAPR